MVNELKALAIESVKAIDSRITLHDFRAVIGTTHTNLIFDVVLPFESKLSELEAKSKISESISSKNHKLFCVITIDRA